MKIRSSVLTLSFFLGADARALSSSALAFVRSSPSTPRTRSRQQRRRVPSAPAPSSTTTRPAHADLVTQLAFYPPGEPLSERLKNIQSEWENVRNGGLGRFLADELEAAERRVRGGAEGAGRSADDAVFKSEDGDRPLEEGSRGASEAGRRIASEIREVRQEFDEIRAAKFVGEAAEDVAGRGVAVEKDLEKVVETLASSLKKAEEEVEAAIATAASNEGLAGSAKVNLVAKLEGNVRNIEDSINAADSVAKAAKQVAILDEKVMAALEKTGGTLSDAIDAAGSLAERLRGSEGGEALDAVSDTVARTAEIVREGLDAAGGVAIAAGRKAVIEADAVMAMGGKAADSVRSVRAVKGYIERWNGPEDSGSLATALAKDARIIESDAYTAGRLAGAIGRDAENDREALAVLGRVSREVDELIRAVDGAVHKVEVVVGGSISAETITGAVERIREEVQEVDGSLDEVDKVAEECEHCSTKEVKEEVEAAISKMEGEKSVFEKTEELTAVTNSDPIEPVVESNVEEGYEEASSVADKDKDGLLAQSEPDLADQSLSEIPTTVSANDVMGGEDAGEAPETAAIASVDHNRESLGDVVASTIDASYHTSSDAVEMASNSISAEDLADVIASAEPPEGLESVLASAAGVATDMSNSISSSSDVVHDVTIKATEGMTKITTLLLASFL